jgi:hypothetical protein
MSIGNLKDSGNQGNNMPWQWQVLRGLQCICDELKEININTDGIEQLLQDIIDELAAGIDVNIVSPLPLPIEILGPLDNRAEVDSVSVVLTNDQFKNSVTPNIIFETIHDDNLAVSCYSISFASNGTADAEISFDGGINYVALPTGTTINMDAGGLAWSYPPNVFYWKTTTNAGASLIITYNN